MQDSLVLVKEQTKRSTQQNREPRNRPTQVYSTSLYDKLAKVIQWSISSTSGAGTNEHPHAKKKKKESRHTQMYITDIIDLNVKHKIINS